MVTFPCPWCEHEMPLVEDTSTGLRCDACETIVDVAVDHMGAEAELALAA
jgi:hypothetical protein